MEKKMQQTIIRDRPYRLHNIYMHYVWKVYTWAHRLLLFTHRRFYALPNADWGCLAHKAAYLPVHRVYRTYFGDDEHSIGTKTLCRPRAQALRHPLTRKNPALSTTIPHARAALENWSRGVIASWQRFVDLVRIVLFQLNES